MPGLIDETEAKRRRKQLATEAEFYGAMDGASRFTQRDAVASILITGINIVAGFLIGVLQHGMEFRKALETYTVLTIGDGLVTVIPALMISISGGLIVTRASSDARLGAEFTSRFSATRAAAPGRRRTVRALRSCRACPKFPFLLMAAAPARPAGRCARARPCRTEQAVKKPPSRSQGKCGGADRVEPLAIEVGLGLVGWWRARQDSALLRRISSIRKQLATELGYMLPPVRVTDNLQLRSPRIPDLAEGRGDRALRIAARLRVGHSSGPRAEAWRVSHPRAGLWNQRRLDPRGARKGAQCGLYRG